jgi:hypothetical protein
LIGPRVAKLFEHKSFAIGVGFGSIFNLEDEMKKVSTLKNILISACALMVFSYSTATDIDCTAKFTDALCSVLNNAKSDADTFSITVSFFSRFAIHRVPILIRERILRKNARETFMIQHTLQS